MDRNNVSAMIVQEEGRAAGIVTDRDLATRAVACELDPKTTMVSEVMTSPVATLALEDSLYDAVRLMQQRKIRHIPLVENECVVGMVTLDDLLVDETTSIDELTAVIVAQIGAGGRPTAMRSTTAPQHGARLRLARGRSGETVLETVLGSIFGA
jgi:signal-transduction protein with cAMP-binding, CBS, and nucleotidyltransferase domain